MGTSGQYFRSPVHDLGSLDSKLEGILSPGYSDSEISTHIHGLFLEGASGFLSFCPVERSLIDHWKTLIAAGLGGHLAKLNGRASTVVDIGSGAGTTVLPILELLPS